MSSRPWMAFYPSDYLADTGHLTTLEHGAYLLLIMHYWSTGGLPPHDAQLARIARVPLEEWPEIRLVLKPFFSEDWRHKRVEFEMTEAARLTAVGRRGAKAKHEQEEKEREQQLNELADLAPELFDGGNGNGGILPLQPQPRKKEKKDIRAVATATRTEEEFEGFWKAYPKREGANPKEPARKSFLAALKRGADPPAIIAGARAYARDPSTKVGTPYVTMAVTWLNQQRWTDYAVPPVHEVELPGFYAAFDSPELEAWEAYGAAVGKSWPRDKRGGWRFETRWPPEVTNGQQGEAVGAGHTARTVEAGALRELVRSSISTAVLGHGKAGGNGGFP